ncbi:hypothetical protein GCM10029964_104050 [Kibdelosporangium lantanae]
MQADLWATGVTRLYVPDDRAPRHPLARGDRRHHRFVDRSQAARVLQGHQWPVHDHAREHHDTVARGQYRLVRGDGDVDAPVAGTVRGRGRDKGAHHRVRGGDRPAEKERQQGCELGERGHGSSLPRCSGWRKGCRRPVDNSGGVDKWALTR